MNKIFFAVTCFVAFTFFAFGQMPDKTSYYSYGTQLWAESHVIQTNQNDSADVLILFKLPYNALGFTQVNPLENPGSFVAYMNIEAIIKDDTGIIRKRATYNDTVYVKKFEETSFKTKYVFGQIKLTLAYAKYKAVVQLNDKYLKSTYKQDLSFDATTQFWKKETVGKAIFGYFPNIQDRTTFAPSILNDNISFTSNNGRILVPATYKSGYEAFNFTINKIESEKSKFWDENVNFTGRTNFIQNSMLVQDKSVNQNTLQYKIIKSDLKINENGLLPGFIDIEIPSNILVPGLYELIVFNEKNKDSVRKTFEVIWEDLPLSLKTIDYAVTSMYNVMTDEEFDALDSGKDIAKFKKILAFWKPKDPTKNTPYNEAMAEYFKRVDYAFFNYQTFRERDGARSERGKIYILYGMPDEVISNLKDGTNTEIWQYKTLKKSFTFAINSTGVFKLMEVKDK